MLTASPSSDINIIVTITAKVKSHLPRGAKVANNTIKKNYMQLQEESKNATYSQEEETNSPEITEQNEQAESEDTDPPLDEEDLEENDLSVEEADQIIWEAPKKSSSGDEEKDITD